MAVLSGAGLGQVAVSRWKGERRKSTGRHLSPYDSDVSSEISRSHSPNISWAPTYVCQARLQALKNKTDRAFCPRGAEF